MFYIFCFCALGVLSAQTGAEIETLLKTSAVTYAQAARFVLRAADAASITNSREAFNYAAERNWLPKNASPDSEARLDGISLLFMRSFNLKGGVFYSLFKNPHYAYRELEALGALKGKSNPFMTVSGEHLLFITNKFLSVVEEKK
jgi:hypothetical protein